MRYAFILYILSIQLLWQSAIEPKVCAPVNKALQEESAGISASSIQHKHYGEITPFLHLNGNVSKVTSQRSHDGQAAILNLSSYLSLQVSKVAGAFPFPPGSPLVKLLLFPNHYFW